MAIDVTKCEPACPRTLRTDLLYINTEDSPSKEGFHGTSSTSATESKMLL